MILVINVGSSSIKYKLFSQSLEVQRSGKSNVSNGQHQKAAASMLSEFADLISEIKSVGYRVVHGGREAAEVMPIVLPTMQIIEKYSPFAPHHNPAAIKVIKFLLEKIPQANHFAIFDTAFFRDLPVVARTYPIPKEIASEFSIERYGFHGLSHQAMTNHFDETGSKKLVTIHLGAGSSISAISSGKPIDTSMGFTPMEGLPMQTRSGDIDPEIVIMLAEQFGLKKAQEIIEHQSGLSGVSGTNGDMLTLLDRDDEDSKLAIDLLAYRTKKYIGAYAAALGGVDIVVFSGEIGYGSEVIRKKIISGLSYLSFETKTLKPDEELAIAEKLIDL